MDDIIAIEYDVTPTIANMLAMADQLATVTAERDERSLVAEQLSMALHIRDTQLATITAERDALRVQLAAATKPPSTGVWMPVEKYTELLAERAAGSAATVARSSAPMVVGVAVMPGM